MTKPFNHIKQLLTHPSLGILSKKSWEYYGENLRNHPVGSGPFYVKSKSDRELKLARNNEYWRRDELGNQLPFLDEIHILTNKDLSDEYLMFADKKVDLLFDLPANELDVAFGTLSDAKKGKNLLHRVHIQKASKINYIAWDVSRPPFNSIFVRKAFLLAIDKNRICNEVLSGDGQVIKHGIIPFSDFYQNPYLPAVNLNINAARELLTKAGYNNSHKFPSLWLYVNAQAGSNADLWCRDLCKQLSNNLGVSISVLNVSTKERDEKIKTGKAILWKAGWVGDYPDAESYLRLFYHGPGKKKRRHGMETQHSEKTPCPHHGRQGAPSAGFDERRRRQQGAPSAVRSQCSSRQAPAAIPASRSGWAL